jgi:hypothetical protein
MGTLAAIDMVLALLTRAQQISALVNKAQAEGRDLTAEEWAEITQADDKARSDLALAIEKAKAEGR